MPKHGRKSHRRSGSSSSSRRRDRERSRTRVQEDRRAAARAAAAPASYAPLPAIPTPSVSNQMETLFIEMRHEVREGRHETRDGLYGLQSSVTQISPHLAEFGERLDAVEASAAAAAAAANSAADKVAAMEERIRALEEGGGGSSQVAASAAPARAGGGRDASFADPSGAENIAEAVFLRAGVAPIALQGPEVGLHFSAWPTGSAEARKECVRRVMASRKEHGRWVPLAVARDDGAEVQVIVAGDRSIAQRRRAYHLRQLALAAAEDCATNGARVVPQEGAVVVGWKVLATVRMDAEGTHPIIRFEEASCRTAGIDATEWRATYIARISSTGPGQPRESAAPWDAPMPAASATPPAAAAPPEPPRSAGSPRRPARPTRALARQLRGCLGRCRSRPGTRARCSIAQRSVPAKKLDEVRRLATEADDVWVQ